jgi:hypothetical protein
VCPACSIRYVNEDLFVGHIRQYHVNLCKQGDFQSRQHESEAEQELSSRILETNLNETNGLQVKQNPSIPANFDCSVEDKSGWGECSSSNRGNQSSNCKSDQLKTAKASYKCTERSYFTRHRPNLVRHETTHSGETEKPFKCSECSYSASRKAHFIAHQRTHSNVKDNTLSNYRRDLNNSLIILGLRKSVWPH